MTLYRHILAAIDLTDEADAVLKKAKSLAQQNGATLMIAHAIEPLALAYGSDIPLELSTLQEEISNHAKKRIKTLAESVQVEDAAQHIVYGRPDKEVHRLAAELNVDLVVVGSHGRHGLALILGSTSTSILHGATCDVLAIRVGHS